jgi:5-bromo-4-chloroindolyl phosphate hydrolysis protein
MTTSAEAKSMSDEEVRRFLAQFEQAREDMKTWPKWMQEAARVAAATFPRPPADRKPKQ